MRNEQVLAWCDALERDAIVAFEVQQWPVFGAAELAADGHAVEGECCFCVLHGGDCKRRNCRLQIAGSALTNEPATAYYKGVMALMRRAAAPNQFQRPQEGE